jgi:hypothetical protein
MARAALTFLFLLTFLVAVEAFALIAVEAPAQDGPPINGSFAFDQILRWEGNRHNTLGPTGRRLFTERIEEKPGLCGVFSYLHPATALIDPATLAFRDEEGPLVMRHIKTIWRPSHLEVRWILVKNWDGTDRDVDGIDESTGDIEGNISVIERKFITESDAIVDQVQVINGGGEPIFVEALARGAATPMLERYRSRQVHVDLAPAANLHPFPGRRIFTTGLPEPCVWVEGENPFFRQGSWEQKGKNAASGGECLGTGGKGGDTGNSGGDNSSGGDLTLYIVVCPETEKGDDLGLFIRYARGGDKSATCRLLVDGLEAGQVTFSPTGGWGEAPGDWENASLFPPALTPGLHKIGFVAGSEDAGVNIDGFFVMTRSAKPPRPAGAARFPAPAVEQVVYLPGSIDYDAVRYNLPDPAAEAEQTLAALRGGTEGDRAFSFPEAIHVGVPDMERSLCTYHLLAAIAAPRGFGDLSPATFRFLLDDGSEESVPLPAIAARLENTARLQKKGAELDGQPARGDRVEWRFLVLPLSPHPCVQLSYVPPPGRFVQSFLFEKTDAAGTPEIPILLAATVEAPPATGRLPAFLGRKDFEGTPVSLALAGSGFVTARGDKGERVLLRSLQIEAEGAETFTIALTTADRDDKAVKAALRMTEADDPFGEHLRTTKEWYDKNTPAFACSDPFMEKAWYYRWFLVRHNMVRPGMPPLTAPLFYEGTHGTRHTAVRASLTHHVLAETRWLRNNRFATGHLRAHLRTVCEDAAGSDVFFRDVRVTGRGALSRNRAIPTAAFGVYDVHNEKQYLDEVSDLLLRNAATLSKYPDADSRETLSPAGMTPEGIKGMTALHFEGGDLSRPYLEAPPAGAPDGMEPCPDRFDRACNDLLIRHAGGLVPSRGGMLILEPSIFTLDHFRFSKIRYHGHDVEIVWVRPGTANPWPDQEEGYTLRVDGAAAAARPDLGPLSVRLD